MHTIVRLVNVVARLVGRPGGCVVTSRRANSYWTALDQRRSVSSSATPVRLDERLRVRGVANKRQLTQRLSHRQGLDRRPESLDLCQESCRQVGSQLALPLDERGKLLGRLPVGELDYATLPSDLNAGRVRLPGLPRPEATR